MTGSSFTNLLKMQETHIRRMIIKIKLLGPKNKENCTDSLKIHMHTKYGRQLLDSLDKTRDNKEVYRRKLENKFQQNNVQDVWSKMKTITGFK